MKTRDLWYTPLALALACSGTSESAPPDPHPEPPSIMRDVALIDDDVQFTHPFVPGHRTTMDGRVAIRVQGGPPGTETVNKNLSFFLFAPEKLEEPIMTGPPGPAIMADAEPYLVPFPPALDPEVARLGHHAICDPTGEFATEGDQRNPYPCGDDEANDCYDLTIVSSTAEGASAQMWGTPAIVEVENPKTVDAAIASVELGEPVSGAVIPMSVEFTEPVVTIDGRLLTGRLGRFPREWKNPETGETLYRPYDLVYSVLPEDAAPCDIAGWTDFHPMSHAPYDPAMIGRYGLAAYPFRDSEGALIPDGEDLGGTYPWVDREGANVFMTAVPGRLAEQSEEQYPRRCVSPGCEAFDETINWDRGFMVAGLWTHGKFVHLDGMINNLDWAVGVTPAAHYLVDLYRDENGPVSVRIGSGRFIVDVRNAGGPYPAGYTHNANIMDSLQHLANHNELARPVTPRDVVWVMSTGVATDEIAFDDLLDPNAFIVSNMQASITQIYNEDGESTGVPVHHNGQVRHLADAFILLADYWLDLEAQADVHLQNAATSLDWKVPAFGRVAAGTSRVEPVALGGVKGRGFWLSGINEIVYPVPGQDREIDDVDWYVGLFVDSRGEARDLQLLRFPDGSSIRLHGRDEVLYRRGGRTEHRVALPNQDADWMHLGWRIQAGGTEVTLLVNGYPIDRLSSNKSLFRMTEGDFVVGRAGDRWKGFRGWIDDLVVLAHDVNPEVACNHARGTLISVEDSSTWSGVAERYPGWAHSEIAGVIGAGDGERYACFVDYTRDYGAHLQNIPEGAQSVREVINFPEGPLRFGKPRPDSSQNEFCLGCHHERGRGGLGLDALEFRPGTPAEMDTRRQPLQPPRRVFGNVPAGWIPRGPRRRGSPDRPQKAPPEGFLIDRWVLP